MTAIDAFSMAWAADQQSETNKTYYGQVTILDAVAYVLRKGEPRRLYDSSIDRPSDARIQIELTITSETRDGAAYDISQRAMDFDDRWKKHTLPSLQKLNITPQKLKGAWVEIERKATGRTYEIRSGEKAGQMADETAIIFKAIYGSKLEMDAAREARFARPDDWKANDQPKRNVPQPVTAEELGGEDPAERATAKAALAPLWQASNQNPQVFEALIKVNPIVSKYYSLSSDDVIAITGHIPF